MRVAALAEPDDFEGWRDAARGLAAEGVGYLAPRGTSLTEEGRTRNRRVEVVLTSTP